MGDARNRARALAAFQPWPEDFHVCPKCRGRRTAAAPAPALALSHVPTLMAVCADCGAVWEAFPPDWSHDAVEASPCDNCAFAKGSPESTDREGWKSLLLKLRAGNEFKCHKGAPLIIDVAAGTIEFDEAWVQRHGRSCAGFVRALQAWPDWLDNRLAGMHVLTKHDQDRLLGDGDEGAT